MPNVIETIKRIALSAVENTKPAEVMFGEVVSASPVKILVEQKLLLEEPFLILTKAVLDHWVDITVDHYTESDPLISDDDVLDTKHTHPNTAVGEFDPTHWHRYLGRKKIKIHNGLLEGEKVILIRLQGGQRYVVLDRINDHTVEGEWIG